MLTQAAFFTGVTKSLISVTLFELGDKTFLIGALLATKHPRRWVFIGAMAALIVMTILSVLFGQAALLLPERWVKIAEITLFAAFGLKLLYDAWRMSPQVGCSDELEAAEKAVAAAEAQRSHLTPWAVMLEACSLVFVAEWGGSYPVYDHRPRSGLPGPQCRPGRQPRPWDLCCPGGDLWAVDLRQDLRADLNAAGRLAVFGICGDRRSFPAGVVVKFESNGLSPKR
jgi:putative Ca2+/H+ antiporter (TMEM165/GDT1 family)